MVGAVGARRMAGSGLGRLGCCRCWSRSMSGWRARRLRIAALRRRGWREWGVVEADNLRRCRDPLCRWKPRRLPMSRRRLPRIVPDAGLAPAGAAGPGARPAPLSREEPDMRVAIIDYGSGNLRSATKAFERAAREAGIAAEIDLTADAERVRTRRPHRAAGRRRLCRLRGRPARRRRHVGGGRGGGDRARRGRSSASASACS